MEPKSKRLRFFATLLREGTTANEDVAALLEKAAAAFEGESHRAKRGAAAARALGLVPISGRSDEAQRDWELYKFVERLRWKRWRRTQREAAGAYNDIALISFAVPNACEADYKKAGRKFCIVPKTAKNVYLGMKKKLA